MSRVYDNWERLVVAVLNREELRRLALCESFSSSISADSSSRFSFDSSLEDVPAASRIDAETFDPTANSSHHGVQEIKFEEIRKATKYFSDSMYLGEGRFSRVFKGWIDEDTLSASKCGSGMAVAAKKRPPPQWKGHQECLIKDMALKVSGKGKPGQAEGSFKKGQRSYPDFDAISEGVPYPYMQPGSSSSTPAWDFTSTGHRATRPDSRFSAFGGDRTPGGLSISAQSGEVVPEDEDEPKEWMAQVEPGVQITFVSLPRGGNDLKRIRFSREMFNKWQAQRWWGENYDRIMELYNVQRFNQQALNSTPGRSEDGGDSTYSRLGSARESPRMTPSLNKEWTPRYKPSGSFPQENLHGGNQQYGVGSSAYPSGGPKGEMSSMEASRTTTDSRDKASVSISNASDIESEWTGEDEPGVYITIRQLVDGTRQLQRVRFSRERVGKAHAKLWWETNRDRIQAQYLCE